MVGRTYLPAKQRAAISWTTAAGPFLSIVVTLLHCEHTVWEKEKKRKTRENEHTVVVACRASTDKLDDARGRNIEAFMIF